MGEKPGTKAMSPSSEGKGGEDGCWGRAQTAGPVMPKHAVHLHERVLCEALLRVFDKTEVRAKLPHTLVVK